MRTIDPALVAEMASGHYAPVTRVYAQPHLPNWSYQTSTGQSLPDNLMGHDCVHAGGYFYRVRSGSLTTPTGGNIYFAKIADTADPSTWEASWTQIATNGCAGPHWTIGGTAPGMMAIAVIGSNVRIFYFGKTGAADPTRDNQVCHDLYVITSTDGGSSWGSPVGIAKVEENALQVAAMTYNEIFFTDYVQVFDPDTLVPYGYESDAVYSCVIRRATESGGTWTVDGLSDWPLRGHWHLYKSARERGNIHDADGSDETWGDPVWAGLGVAERRDGATTVVSGGILKHAVGYDNDAQGLVVFTHDSTWDYQAAVSWAEFAEDSTWWDVFARASNVNGNLVAVWQNEDEPTDVLQDDVYSIVPRGAEIVYSYSKDGVLWTEPQAIVSDQHSRQVGTGPIILVGDTLYYVTWYHVLMATVTHVWKSDAPKTDITDAVAAWSFKQTGRSPDTQMQMSVVDPGAFAADPGDLITVQAGAEVSGVPTLETVGQGYLATVDDGYSIDSRLVGGQASVLMAKPLADTKSRDATDILPQEYMLIEPTDMLTQLTYEWGDWHVKKADSDFWSAHASMAGIFENGAEQTFVEISTFDNVVQDMGWWHQLAFLTYPATMNGQFTVKMRMGLMMKDTAFYTGTKNFGSNIYCTYTNGFGNRWGISGGPEADLDFCAGGIAFRGRDSYSTYVFAWEPGLRSWNRAAQPGNQSNATCHPDTSFGWVNTSTHQMYAQWKRNPIRGSAYGSETFGAYTIADMVGDDSLVLYLFYNEEEGENRTHEHGAQKRYLLARVLATGITRGDPVEMHVVTYYGYIYCYYRDLVTDGDWQLAFAYDAGAHLGAGRFGLYGRGYNGPEGAEAIDLDMRNRTWFWDARMANETKNTTLEEVCKTMAWRAGVEVSTDAAIDESGAGLYSATAQNPVIGAELSLTAKAGFMIRASDANNGIRLGVTPGSAHANLLTLEVIESGSPVKTLKRPSYLAIPSGTQLEFRFSATDNWYSVWMGDKLLGTFHFQYDLSGQGIGGFGSATFHSVRMPELVEIPQYATIDINQSMLDAIRDFLGQRRIKRFLTHDGVLRLSYYLTHPDAGTIADTMIRNAVRKNDEGVTHARVMGGLGWAEYKSTHLNRGIRRFVEVALENVMDRSVAYI
jgi:hypothetical protein